MIYLFCIYLMNRMRKKKPRDSGAADNKIQRLSKRGRRLRVKRQRFQQGESLLHPVFTDDKSAHLALVIRASRDHAFRLEGDLPVQILTLGFTGKMQR